MAAILCKYLNLRRKWRKEKKTNGLTNGLTEEEKKILVEFFEKRKKLEELNRIVKGLRRSLPAIIKKYGPDSAEVEKRKDAIRYAAVKGFRLRQQLKKDFPKVLKIIKNKKK